MHGTKNNGSPLPREPARYFFRQSPQDCQRRAHFAAKECHLIVWLLRWAPEVVASVSYSTFLS